MLAAPGSVLATVARTLASPRRRRPSWTPSNLTAAERVHIVSGVSQPRCLETHGLQDTVPVSGCENPSPVKIVELRSSWQTFSPSNRRPTL
jgi:hypothetical protein